jgi:hypothetical protein
MAEHTKQPTQPQVKYSRLGHVLTFRHSGIVAALAWRPEQDGWRPAWWLSIEGGRAFPVGATDEHVDAGQLVTEICARYIGDPPPTDHARIWGGYACSVCHATGVKLWRDSHTFLDSQTLACRSCAEREAGKPARDGSDQIGSRVPAVPTADGATFWGYSSVPEAACRWWRALPGGVS